MVDPDSGVNGEIQSVEIISAVSSRQKEARSHFTLKPTPLTISQPRFAEYELKVAQSLEHVGEKVSQSQCALVLPITESTSSG